MFKGAKVVLTLANPQGQSLPLIIHIQHHPLAQKFTAELGRTLRMAQQGESKWSHLQKNYAFLGWSQGPRSWGLLCQQMNQYIDLVNSFSEREGWAQYNRNYLIPLKFTPPIKEDIFNQVHHHFELMMGQVWERSEFFLDADDEVRFALVQINHLCHEMEALERSQKQLSPVTQISFLEPRRLLLEESDYQFFSEQIEFGQAVLHYCQTSKTHWDAFYDQDPLVEKKNVNYLRYYSGEFDLLWGAPTAAQRQEYHQWLGQHWPDLSATKRGHAIIGQVDLGPFAHLGEAGILDCLKDFQDIAAITLQTAQFEVRADFPYKSSDDDYMQRQLRLFAHD